MFSPQNSFDYTQPTAKPSGKKKKLIAIGAIVAVLVMGGILVAIMQKDKFQASDSNNPQDMSIEEQFIDDLARGDAESLVQNSQTLFKDKKHAIQTIDRLQADLDLNSCKVAEEPKASTVEDVTYSQQAFNCDINQSLAEESAETSKQSIVLTRRENEIVFLQTAKADNAYTTEQLAKAFSW